MSASQSMRRRVIPAGHCLRWAQPGEQVILFPYASIAAGRPYAESGPIFVHEKPCSRYAATDEYPADLRSGRVIRAYNAQHDMIAAEAVASGAPKLSLKSCSPTRKLNFYRPAAPTAAATPLRSNAHENARTSSA
jgi:hypothetical protein